MRRIVMLFLVAMLGATFAFSAAAWADSYAGGTAPAAGPTSGPPTQVLGEQFTRPVSNNGVQVLGIQFTRTPNGLATTGADIAELVAIALAAVALGTLLVSRSRRPQLA